MKIIEETVEWSIHPPSLFIRQHWQRLLPHWSRPVSSMLLLLQRSPVALDDYTSEAAISKRQMRDRAILLTASIVESVCSSRHDAVLFDPKTGFPYQSRVQGIPLNDVAVVSAALGYSLKQCGKCHCVVHPHWGSRVYPGVLVSSASLTELKAIAKRHFSLPLL